MTRRNSQDARRANPRVEITLPPDVLSRLDAIARERSLSRSGAIAEIVRRAKPGTYRNSRTKVRCRCGRSPAPAPHRIAGRDPRDRRPHRRGSIRVPASAGEADNERPLRWEQHDDVRALRAELVRAKEDERCDT